MDEQQKPQPANQQEPAFKLTRKFVRQESWFQSFHSNLKDFLTERPVKVPRGSGHGAFEQGGFGSSLSDNFKEWLKPLPPSARTVPNSELLVARRGWFASFWENVRDTVSPRKLPPLELTSEPVDVPEIWSKNKQFTKVQALSLVFHVVVIVLIVLPLLPSFVTPPTQANNVKTIEISPFLPKLAMGNKRAGGGGGRHDIAPAKKGALPKFTLHQITPPVVKPLPQPKLVAEASVVVPPNIHIPNPNTAVNGNPISALVNDSMGNGSGSGLGNGNGSGVGSGSEYGIGGGPPMAGENGYGKPGCLYCPNPQFSDAAFKLKIQGEVVLDVIIGADGRARNIHVVKGLGYGLDEEAVKSVRDIWHFQPAIGPDGKPAAVRMEVEVDFHLY